MVINTVLIKAKGKGSAHPCHPPLASISETRPTLFNLFDLPQHLLRADHHGQHQMVGLSGYGHKDISVFYLSSLILSLVSKYSKGHSMFSVQLLNSSADLDDVPL
jgi:hypothetical protein